MHSKFSANPADPLDWQGNLAGSKLVARLGRAHTVRIMPGDGLDAQVSVRLRARHGAELDSLVFGEGDQVSIMQRNQDMVYAQPRRGIMGLVDKVFGGGGSVHQTQVVGSNRVVNQSGLHVQGDLVAGQTRVRQSGNRVGGIQTAGDLIITGGGSYGNIQAGGSIIVDGVGVSGQSQSTANPTLELDILVPYGFDLELDLATGVNVVVGNVGGCLRAEVSNGARLDVGTAGHLRLEASTGGRINLAQTLGGDGRMEASTKGIIRVDGGCVDNPRLEASTGGAIHLARVDGQRCIMEGSMGGRISIDAGLVTSLSASVSESSTIRFGGSAISAELEACTGGRIHVDQVTTGLEQSTSTGGIIDVGCAPQAGMRR